MFNVIQYFIAAHCQKLEHVGNPLLNWLHDYQVLARGFFVEGDFPLWVGLEEKKSLMSRGRMWLVSTKK